MRLCIVRHGTAEIGADEDPLRQLTDKGLREAQGAGRWLAEMLADGNLSAGATIYASPYLRARQTAEAIAFATSLPLKEYEEIVPHGRLERLVEQLATEQTDIVLVSHLPLVGRLAAQLVDGQIYDQPWSPAECWVLEGDIAASGCMSVASLWYPALDKH
ncbi:MAG: phosphohistidine phosphatase SixA [Saccharospirillaceae bacterium]|nr:phosphohistidine phosphatase SixA [Saccharospirillaceae bacterium]